MKKFLLLLLFIPLVSFGQSHLLNGYKYIYIPENKIEDVNGDKNYKQLYSLQIKTRELFRSIGLISVHNYDDFVSKKNICELLIASIEYSTNGVGMGWVTTTTKTQLTFKLYNCNSELVYSNTRNKSSEQGLTISLQDALIRTLFKLTKKKYKFDTKLTPSKKELSNNKVTKKSVINEGNSNLIISKDEAKKQLIELKEYLDLGIITQDEFDKKAVSLKKILLGN